MSLIQDKLGSEFLRPGGGMEASFSTGMLMFSHLPPVTSFTRLAGQSVMAELQPHDFVLKKERHSPDCDSSGGAGGGLVSGAGMMPGMGDYMPAMGIKQEKVSELDYRQPMYPSDGERGGTEMLEMTLSNHQNLLIHDLSMGNLSGRLGKDSSGRKGRRSNGDGQEGKTRRKRGESKSLMLDPDGGTVSPSSKPHICEHCSAAFRSSYHLRRHVLIHTGERPFRCNQCNMSFIQKYLLQRHEKIHSGEKPFSCDQCNMRFIQKYHMERHKRTHSGEKPYKCDTCQQYFSRTDRLLKHKRTCGDGIKKDLDEMEMEMDREHGSYAITQGNVTTPGRKRGKSKTGGEGGKRKRASGPSHSQGTEGYGLHDFNTVDNHGHSLSSSASASHPGQGMHGEPVPAPKMAFKKGHRKGLEKNAQSKLGNMELSGDAGMDDMGLLQSHKVGQSSSSNNNSANYDDAMQFLKKRRYLPGASNGGVGGGATGYDVGVSHLQAQPVVVQGIVSGVMDGDSTLGLLDSSPLADIKPDKSGIPDEVLQSLLEHYGHKTDVTFDLSDPHHVELEHGTAEGVDPMGAESNQGGGDKMSLMHEYSRFLLQALERTSHSGGFVLGPTPSSSSTSSSNTVASFPTYTTSPLEFSFGLPASSSPSTLNSSVPKPHFGLLGSSSPSQGFHLSGLEPTAHSQHSQQPQPQQQQQLTPSQELTEQLEKQHNSSPPAPPHTPNSSAYQLPAPTTDLSGQKDDQGSKNSATGFSMVPAKGSYQIENFAQAFGGQFKGGRRPLVFGTDSGTDVEQFSGYSSLLASVSDTKSPQSQSYN
ncbi:hypothetical protein KOW79_001351 [Hemibagrus wyckioides]|uniref:Zinc finger protein 281 n=1 Tax=Hemibagrus wyckioides TaxID=337641 RepID=A0A9D3P808_9TELE|nr:zinc finger protein 281 [Hemibagrus wyckioides]XP_058230579.1 zinc finger protein 281 [Hemibagrus wyckioides]KAG7334755.1 hypothetical protein KOW79_001351 [Hemibagrus wyckioides]